MTSETPEVVEVGEADSLANTQRHCGRCQLVLLDDPELSTQPPWALCPACSAILLPKDASSPKWSTTR